MSTPRSTVFRTQIRYVRNKRNAHAYHSRSDSAAASCTGACVGIMSAPVGSKYPADEEPPKLKTVLVCVGGRKRTVSFSCGEESDRVRLLVAANAVYQGVAVFDGKTIVQMKSEEWSGEFIDVEDTPDKAIVRVVESVSCCQHRC